MLTIRLRRMGSKKRPRFRVVVIEARVARDGRFIEVLGHYNPQTQPEVLHVDHERLAHWLQQGARPSDTVRTLLARHPVVARADAAPVAAEGQPSS
ncbi:MAG: 30S ribosomal protein S16 [Gemmatimonadales bacterium]